MSRPNFSEVIALWRLRIREKTRVLRTKLPPGTLDAIALPALLLVLLILLYIAAQIAINSNFRKFFVNIRHGYAYLRSSSGGMDGLMWMFLSWTIVGGLCYFALNKLGVTNSQEKNVQNQSLRSANDTSNVHANNSEWANEILAWLYNNFHKVPGPLDAWIKSLNDAAKKVTNPSKCEILFEGFGDHSTVTTPPNIRNVRVEKGPRDHLTLRSDVHIPHCKLRLVSSQRTPQKLIVTNFETDVQDLRGEVEARIACIAGQLYVMGCFSGRPEMNIQLHNMDRNTTAEVDHQLVEESIRRCLLSAVTNINLSEATLLRPSSERDTSPSANHAAEAFRRATMQNVMPTPAFQQFQQQHEAGQRDSKGGAPNTWTQPLSLQKQPSTDKTRLGATSGGYNRSQDDEYITASKPVEEMFKRLNETQLIPPGVGGSAVPNKLRVKVVRAQRLGRNIEVQQPYVVIETDEPPQKFQTLKGIGVSPYWEEQFDFDLNPASEEMLFEVYEGSQKAPPGTAENNFLGLAIVNLEEVRRSGEAHHTLNLQGRPYRNDVVAGNITCQFDYYYDPTSTAIGKVSESVIVKNGNGSEFRETISTHKRAVYDPHDNADEIIPQKTTTVTVKTVSQTLKERPVIQSVHGSMENAMDPIIQGQLDRQLKELNEPTMSQSAYSAMTESHSQPTAYELHDTQKGISVTDDRQERHGRDRQKKEKDPSQKRDRSFFGAMKDRLSGRSRSAKRSKSVDANGPEIEEAAVSLPPSRDVSRTRYGSEGGKFTETSSVGGRSGESTRSLYQHSTLVLELNHKGQQKYFLIPPNMVAEPGAARLMKRGKKLHIYNEHTFVAVKCRSSVECNVCNQRIGRSFSKQAYQCRDCKMVCHKSCHYKTDTFCTNSTVSKLQIAKDVDWAHFLSHYELEEFISFEGL